MSQPPSKYTPEWIDAEADLFLEWMKKPRSIWFKNFAIERGYDPARLVEFSEKNEKFAQVMKVAKSWQEGKILEFGLWGDLNSSITKFVLINHHGHKDSPQIHVVSESKLSSIDGKSSDLVPEKT
jgi:hypothetical protein